MRRREVPTVNKYRFRLAREFARQHLEEVFRFLESGVPDSWNGDGSSKEEVEEAQTAFKEILAATCTGDEPPERSLKVFERCLNLEVGVECFRKELLRNGTRTAVVRFNFFTKHYLRHVAGRLRTCLYDFYEMAIFSPDRKDWLVALCVHCGEIFLQKKSNQLCCSRKCTNAYDYAKRGKAYYREKSRKSYHSPGATKKRARRKGKVG